MKMKVKYVLFMGKNFKNEPRKYSTVNYISNSTKHSNQLLKANDDILATVLNIWQQVS